MFAFIVIVFIVIGILVAIAFADEKKKSQNAAEEYRQRLETEKKYKANRETLMEGVMEQLPFKTWSMIDDSEGFVGMDSTGRSLHLIVCDRDGASLSVLAEEVIPVAEITSIEIDQPKIAKTITHTDMTPVAVGSQRSPVGRALVGAAIAGPAGAVVGGMSGLGGKSKIELVKSHRHETIKVTQHPKLVIGIDDLSQPRRVLEFETVRETNQWSSRIWTAMNRRP